MAETYSTDYVVNKFTNWYTKAINKYKQLQLDNVNALSLSTVNNNKPTSRMVLLKSYNNNGFVFFTNYNGAKSSHISYNNNVALLFYWLPLNIQIRIEGTANKISVHESEEYFHTRPYLSKIGAWASQQSKVITKKNNLYLEVLKYSAKFKQSVPYAPHWGGFCVNPTYIEFWQQKPFRLHKRQAYTKTNNNNWVMDILYP